MQSISSVNFYIGNSDVYLALTTAQTFSIVSSTSSLFSPSVACSVSGSTSITYSIADYSGTIHPSWATVNSNTGKLAISAPTVSAITSFSFYVDSTVSGITNPAHSLVTITVTVPCNVLNCQTCSSSSVCVTCNAGFTLSSGSCPTPFTVGDSYRNLPTAISTYFDNYYNTSLRIWTLATDLEHQY